MDQQALLEEQLLSSSPSQRFSALTPGASPAADAECRAPEPCTTFQTARLLLSHLGMLNLGSLKVLLQY
jgi:hypothetical protein